MSTTGENSLNPNLDILPQSADNINPSNPMRSVDEDTEGFASSEAYDESKLSSDVWQHFKKSKIYGKWRAVCNYCSKPLISEQKSCTSHLKSHSDKCKKRPRVHDLGQAILRGGQKRVDGKQIINSGTFNQEEARRLLVEMIILHEYPLSIVDHEGFRDFLSALQPLFKVPTRNTIRSDIIKLYKEKMSSTMHALESNKGRISITTDMWTAEHQEKGYMAITAHFIDDSWVLQERVLR